MQQKKDQNRCLSLPQIQVFSSCHYPKKSFSIYGGCYQKDKQPEGSSRKGSENK